MKNRSHNKERDLPDFLEVYFWDIEFESLDLTADSFIIIERILNFGDLRALKWVLESYNSKQLEEVVRNSRRLTQKTANYWQKHLRIREEDMRCFRKHFPKTGKRY